MSDVHTTATEVLERIDDAFFALDEQWQFTYLNEQAEDVLDVDRDDVLGEVVWEAFEPAVGTTFQDQYERAMESQEPVSFEEYYAPLSTWFEVNAYPSETGLSVYFRDVTERIERELQLQQYEQVIQTVDDGIYVVDADGTFTMVNDAYAEMFGYDRTELLGSDVSMVADEQTAQKAAELESEMRDGVRETASLEATVEREGGQQFEAEATFSMLPGGDRVGVVRDVSDRKQREQRLRKRIVQQEGVTEFGKLALADRNVDQLMADAARLVAETLDTDYCKVLNLDDAGEQLVLRQGVGWHDGIVGSATVSATAADSQAAYTLASDEPVVVSNLDTETRFSGPDLLTDHDVTSGVSTIIGPVDDPWGIFGAHDTGEKVFSEYDVNFVQSVANILAAAIERHRDEVELRDSHDRLAALNDINSLVHSLAESIFGLSSKDEIQQLVCDRLAASNSYEFAWVGVVDEGRIIVDAESGVEGYLDELELSVDAPADAAGPTALAHETGEMQVVQDVRTDPRYEQWREHAASHGYRASAAVPIADGDMHGTLNVYSGRANAFDEEERHALRRLGSILEYALSSVERDRELQRERNRLEFMNRLLRHNMLNSLNVVIARLDLLDGRVDYEVHDDLEVATDRTQEMIEFVQTVRNVTNVIGQDDPQALEPRPLDDVLESRVVGAQQTHPDAEYHLKSLPSVDIVAGGLLGELLDNILFNAVQHNPDPNPNIWIGATVHDTCVEVAIADDGPGIPAEQQDAIFDLETRNFHDPSSGFGLYLVSEIMSSYGGDITVTDNDHGGATFRLTFDRPD